MYPFFRANSNVHSLTFVDRQLMKMQNQLAQKSLTQLRLEFMSLIYQAS